MKTKYIFIVLIIAMTTACSEYFPTGPSSGGKTIFNTRTMGGCAVCHKTTSKKLVGPGLAGVSKLHTEPWMRRWLKNPQKVWEENDPETAAMKKRLGKENRSKTAMKMVKQLSDPDIEELIKYMKSL